MVAKYGDWFTYEHTPRANIFRRDHHKVVDMDSALRLMRLAVPTFGLVLHVDVVLSVC